MSPAPLWVSVVLLGILVAVAVPVLLQLRKTLATADNTLEIAEQRLGTIMKELSETLGHVNRTSAEIEKLTKSLTGTVTKVRRIGSPIERVKSSVRTVAALGGALGPMVIGAVRGALNWNDPGAHERHRLPMTKEMQ